MRTTFNFEQLGNLYVEKCYRSHEIFMVSLKSRLHGNMRRLKYSCSKAAPRYTYITYELNDENLYVPVFIEGPAGDTHFTCIYQ